MVELNKFCLMPNNILHSKLNKCKIILVSRGLKSAHTNKLRFAEMNAKFLYDDICTRVNMLETPIQSRLKKTVEIICM